MDTLFKTEARHFAGQARTGTETFAFDLPAGQHFSRCRFNVSSSPSGGGANIVEQPAPGATGRIELKFVWWLAALRPPGPLRLPSTRLDLEVEVWVDDSVRRGRAMLVCIENTGAVSGNLVPMPYRMSAEEQMVIRRTVDTVAEVSEYLICSRLFRERYDTLVILADTECTKANIRERIKDLASQCDLDMSFIGHGGRDSTGNAALVLHGNERLSESDVLAWRGAPEFRNLNLGLVYMMNCQASHFSDSWLNLGFKTSIGPVGDNWMPEPMHLRFWQNYLAGDPACNAAQRSWEEAKALWQVVPGFLPLVHVDPGVPPRVVVDDPGSAGRGHVVFAPPPAHWVWDEQPRAPVTHLDPGRPPSMTTEVNARILDSQPRVAGNANRRF